MSVNQIEENELKLGETVNAIKILSTAVLLGVQRTIDRYGDKHNIPPSLRRQLISGIQKGGQSLMNNLSTAKSIYDIKKAIDEKLKSIGIDRQTINLLKNAKSIDDLKRIGIDKLKKFGITEQQLNTLNNDQLKKIGFDKLKQIGVLDKMGLTQEQLMNMRPSELRNLGSEKLKQSGTEKLKSMGVLDKVGLTEEQFKSLDRNQIKQLGTDKLKQLGEKVGITSDELERLKTPDNPDNEKGIVSLVASKTFSNVKTMYIAFIKKIIIVTDFFISRIIDYVTHDTLNTPVNELTANTNKRVLVLAAYLRAVANNPEQIEAIREISEALGVLGIEFVDSIRPAIDKMVDKLSETSERVASQAASGAMKTFIAISTSLIAEVPGVGGVVDLIISFAIGFNSIMRVVRTFVSNNSSLFEYGADALNNSIQTVKRNSGRLTSGINKFKEGMSTNLSNEPMTGGYIKSNSNKMSKSRKRIEFSVHKFKDLNNHTHDKQHYRHSRTKKYVHY